jgi:hypothetical protein
MKKMCAPLFVPEKHACAAAVGAISEEMSWESAGGDVKRLKIKFVCL